jgi:hypothetical protein
MRLFVLRGAQSERLAVIMSKASVVPAGLMRGYIIEIPALKPWAIAPYHHLRFPFSAFPFANKNLDAKTA